MTQTDRTAIVTGASKGIGAAIARRLGRDGCAVAVNYAGDTQAAARVVAEITEAGGRAVAVQQDLSQPGAMAALFDAAEAALGPVDILVNNAGVMRLSTIAETSDEVFEMQVALNLGGVFRGLREASTRLRDGGRIVTLSSSVVGLCQPGYGVYAATKAAVEALTRVLSRELGARQITVNAVAPGPVGTELFLNGKSEELIRSIAARSPFNRLGTPEDIASAVSLLTGPDGGWINGQVLRANGGMN